MSHHLRWAILLVIVTASSGVCDDDVGSNFVTHEFQIDTDPQWIKLLLKVDRREMPFVIDTGATTTVYDESLKSLLGAPKRKVTLKKSGRDRVVETFQAPEASLQGMSLPTDSEVLLDDFRPLSRAVRNEMLGVIGMSQLKLLNVELNCGAGRIRILNRILPEAGNEVRIRYSNARLPHVECSLAKTRKEYFLVDTGLSQAIILEPIVFDSLQQSNKIIPTGRVVRTGGGSQMEFSAAGLLSDFSIAGLELNDLVVLRGIRGGKNMLGMRFLSRFVVTFDFPNGTMYLRPGLRFAEPDVLGIQGFGVYFGGDDLIVVSVDENGPADKAGLRTNDAIEQIDGVGIAGKSLYQLQRAFEKPGHDLNLRVRRGEETRLITVLVPERHAFVSR